MKEEGREEGEAGSQGGKLSPALADEVRALSSHTHTHTHTHTHKRERRACVCCLREREILYVCVECVSVLSVSDCVFCVSECVGGKLSPALGDEMRALYVLLHTHTHTHTHEGQERVCVVCEREISCVCVCVC